MTNGPEGEFTACFLEMALQWPGFLEGIAIPLMNLLNANMQILLW